MKKSQFTSTITMSNFELNVKEDEQGYTIEAKIPGVRQEDILLDLDQGRLVIGVLSREPADGVELPHPQRPSRNFCLERSISLFNTADEAAEARLGDGSFVITVPKTIAESKDSILELS